MKTSLKKIRNLVAALTLATLVIPGCYYDNFQSINPAAGLINLCDTTSPITYAKQVTNVFNGYCNSCHSSSVQNGSVSLDSYSGVMTSQSRIIGALRHQAGFKPMPPNTQIDECSIREIEMWMAAGALNN